MLERSKTYASPVPDKMVVCQSEDCVQPSEVLLSLPLTRSSVWYELESPFLFHSALMSLDCRNTERLEKFGIGVAVGVGVGLGVGV